MEAAGLALGVGFVIAAGLLVGYYLDRWLSTSPLLTLFFSLAALVIAVRRIIAAGSADRGAP